MTRNVLWIMCDQLRHDYLGCAGHPTIRTPNIDGLARRGVRFTNAYVQSPVCGPSRASFYTGRYVSSHGATGNGIPLRVGEWALGDHLRPLGVTPSLVGKTHMVPDREGMARLGIDPASALGERLAEAGFDAAEREDGLYPCGLPLKTGAYQKHLRKHGYSGDNPWHEWANTVDTPEGPGSGWFNIHADRAARIPEPDSETAYATDRAIDFVRSRTAPWFLHLSFIKPHWPYIAPAPYHAMYGPDDVPAAVRSNRELIDPNPLLRHFQERLSGTNFSRDDVRRAVIPAYMGLISQIDDHLGRLFAVLEETGAMSDTLVVFSSDHGDYLGDHWLGDKDYFHDASVKVPLIVVDPTPEADATRGTVCDRLVEGIDLLPTFVDWLGGHPDARWLEGRSLMPLLRSAAPVDWRPYAFSEFDYAQQAFRPATGRSARDSVIVMVTDGRWKLIHAPGFAPVLFDRETDPGELADLGANPAHQGERDRLMAALSDWALRWRQRTTRSDEQIDTGMTGREEEWGVLIGYWTEADLDDPAHHPARIGAFSD